MGWNTQYHQLRTNSEQIDLQIQDNSYQLPEDFSIKLDKLTIKMYIERNHDSQNNCVE